MKTIDKLGLQFYEHGVCGELLIKYLKFCINKQDRIHKVGMHKHHILPKCLGGTLSAHNKVFLSPSEHIKAHELLGSAMPWHERLAGTATFMRLQGEDYKKCIRKVRPTKPDLDAIELTHRINFRHTWHDISDTTPEDWEEFMLTGEIVLGRIGKRKKFRSRASSSIRSKIPHQEA